MLTGARAVLAVSGVLGAMTILGWGSVPAMQAGGAEQNNPAAMRQPGSSLTVEQGTALCWSHRNGVYQVTMHGLFLLQDSPALVHDQGALFDSAEIPVSAVYGDNIRKYHGIAASIPRSVYQRRGAPSGPIWLVVRGVLHCQYPHVYISSWSRAKRAATEHIPALPQVLTPGAALQLCTGGDGGRERVSVRGYYIVGNTLYVSGVLYRKRPADGVPQEKLPAVVSLRYRASRVLPDRARVTLRGLLDCTVRPYQLEVYTWKR